MYIIKNALRCIGRSKGRNILISIIALVIAVSACLGLSIRQAAESAKKSALEELNITATISYDRSSMMNNMTGGGTGQGSGKFDRDQFKNMMGSASALTLEQYQTYASAESVEDFYYTLTASFNGSDELLPVTDETEEETESTFESIGGSSQGKGSGSTGGRGGKGGGMGGGFGGISSGNGSIVISGGNLYINSSGDGLDANGTLEITGGYTVVVGPTQGDTATLDYDKSGIITGGTFIGTGASGMAQSFSDSEQGVVAISVGNQSAGTKIVLKDKSGNTIIEHTPELNFAVVILSSPDIKKSETYTVTVGSESGEFEAN